MNINIPPDSREWLFSSNHVSIDGASWSFRWPPACVPNDPIYFRFDGKIVARACVYMIGKPGELNGWAHHGKRYLRGHKVIWLWSSFEDLRNKPDVVALCEKYIKRARLRRRLEAERGDIANVIRTNKDTDVRPVQPTS